MKKKLRVIVSVLTAGILTGCSAGAGAATGTGSTQPEAVSEAASEASESETTTSSLVNTEEGKYPIHWDLTDIYADTDAWQEDYDKAYALLDEYDSFVGKMNNVDDIYAYLEFCYGGELTEIESRLGFYADLGSSLNAGDDTFGTLQNKFNSLLSQENIKNAFFRQELLSIPYEERVEILEDPKLEDFRMYLLSYLNPHVEAKSEETVRSENILEQTLNSGYSTMQAMLYQDIQNPEITLPDGTTVELDDGAYTQIESDSTIDRETKKEAARLRYSKTEPYINIAASALESTAKACWSRAQLENYDTTRECAMERIHLDSGVYDKLIDGVHDILPDFQRYEMLHGEALGLEDQYNFELYTSVSDYSRNLTEYDDAVDEVRDTLEIYGEDYISYYDEIINGGHVDVYPSDSKTTGQFTQDSAAETRPYVLFNYGGSFRDVREIAHEMGAAVYDTYAQDNQGPENRITVATTEEVASTLNELMFLNAKIDNAESIDEKLYYLENEIDLFNDELIYQAMNAEFEDSVYQLVESGESVSADRLNEMFAEIYHTYRGDDTETLDENKYMWSQITHFHYGYVVYQYACTMSYASGIYMGIRENGQEAIDAYKEFLKAGNSAEPRELFLITGIDIENENTYEKTKEYYSDLIDQYEALLQERDS